MKSVMLGLKLHSDFACLKNDISQGCVSCALCNCVKTNHHGVFILFSMAMDRAVNANNNGDGEEAVVLSDDEDQDRATKPGDGGNSGHLQSQSPRKVNIICLRYLA